MKSEVYIGIGALGALGIVSQMSKKKSKEDDSEIINKLIFDNNRKRNKKFEIKKEQEEKQQEQEEKQQEQQPKQFGRHAVPLVRPYTVEQKNTSNTIEIDNKISGLTILSAASNENKKAKEAAQRAQQAEIESVKAQAQARFFQAKALIQIQAANQQFDKAEKQVDDLEKQLSNAKAELKSLREQNNSNNNLTSEKTRSIPNPSSVLEVSEFTNAIKSPKQIDLENKIELARAIINKNAFKTNEYDDIIKKSELDPTDFNNLNDSALEKIKNIKKKAEEELLNSQ